MAREADGSCIKVPAFGGDRTLDLRITSPLNWAAGSTAYNKILLRYEPMPLWPGEPAARGAASRLCTYAHMNVLVYFSRLRYILARQKLHLGRKMRHNSRQSDNSICFYFDALFLFTRERIAEYLFRYPARSFLV